MAGGVVAQGFGGLRGYYALDQKKAGIRGQLKDWAKGR